MAAVSPTGVVDAVLLLGERVSTPSSRSRVDGVEVARHTPSSRRRVAGASWDQEPHTFREGLCGTSKTLGKPSRRIGNGGHVLDVPPQFRRCASSGAPRAP